MENAPIATSCTGVTILWLIPGDPEPAVGDSVRTVNGAMVGVLVLGDAVGPVGMELGWVDGTCVGTTIRGASTWSHNGNGSPFSGSGTSSLSIPSPGIEIFVSADCGAILFNV